jgi:hypothetical protein
LEVIMPLDSPPLGETAAKASNRLAIVDSDIHPAVKSLNCLKPYVEKKWWDHATTYGFRRRHGSPTVEPYPKSAPLARAATRGRRTARAVRARRSN